MNKKKLEEIHRKNAQWEKESPYNFCDRWCDRCACEKQIRCTLYKDELERKLICIAYGRDENDLEITEAVIKEQYKKIDENLRETMDELGIDPDASDTGDFDEERLIDFEDLPEDIQGHIRFVENNPFDTAAKNYYRKTHAFLQDTFYNNYKVDPALKYHFETIAWYHALLPAKLHRALCGFHEAACEDEFALYDAVAQFQVCKKAITLSVDALRKITTTNPVFAMQTKEMLALLHDIHSRITAMEERI